MKCLSKFMILGLMFLVLVTNGCKKQSAGNDKTSPALELQTLYVEKSIGLNNSYIEKGTYTPIKNVFQEKKEINEAGKGYYAFYYEDICVRFIKEDNGECYYNITKGNIQKKHSCAGNVVGDGWSFVHYEDINGDRIKDIVIIYQYESDSSRDICRYGLTVADGNSLEPVHLLSKYGTSFTEKQANDINTAVEKLSKEYPGYLDFWNPIKGESAQNQIGNTEMKYFNLRFRNYSEGPCLVVDISKHYYGINGFISVLTVKLKPSGSDEYLVDVISMKVYQFESSEDMIK